MTDTGEAPSHPTGKTSATLLYDGDCGICREWVSYWEQLTGGMIRFRPYQESTNEYPNIPREDLDAAIHLIEDNGIVSRGAEATYKLYRNTHPHSLLLFLYRYLPGFAFISEAGYGFFSTHRRLLTFLTHLFWGRAFGPSRYAVTSRLFLCLLGCIYLAAFLSFFVQAGALIGSDGIMPLQLYLDLVKNQLGEDAYFRLPTLFWLSSGDRFIQLVCISGMVLSLFLISGLLLRTSLVLLYILYLSLVHGGQVFMTFQWDLLLLECGFLAIFLPWGSTIIVWLFRWLVFRFMFLGGVVKIVSGDPTWDNLTALFYHFETQPLPTPLGWYAHHLPDTVLTAMAGLTLFIELILPFLIFSPRRFRHMAAWVFIVFQGAIIITGNYNFFNLLTIAMCLFLFDDAAIGRLLPSRLTSVLPTLQSPAGGKLATCSALIMACVSVYISGIQIHRSITHDRTSPSPTLVRTLYPFGIVNGYGPFAVMTTIRNEIIIEGSDDKTTWKEYRFRYKPGGPEECPGWVTPHQPRVDWQMWFAALSPPERQIWLQNLLIKLLQNSQPVKALFAHNPFPDAAPVSIRARYYQYTFTAIGLRRETGRCWNRTLVGEYVLPISLN